MKINNTASELQLALATLSPYFKRAAWFSVVSSLLVLAPSVYMLDVYDRVLNSRNYTTLAMLTLAVLMAYVLMEVLEWARSELLHEAGIALDRRMSGRVFDVIFEASLKRMPGGTPQVMTDLRTIREFLSSQVLLALMDAPISLVLLALIFAINPLLGYAAIGGAIVQVIITWLTERSTQPRLLAANRSSTEAQAYADGSLRNAQVIESMGMLRDIHRRWMDKQREFIGLQSVASALNGGYQAVAKFVQVVMGSLLLGMGAWLLLHKELNGGAGMMIIASVLGGRALAPLVQIVAQWRGVINVREAWGRLDNLLANSPLRPPNMALPAPRGFVKVENLIAGAPGTNGAIIRGVQFSLSPGEVLAVVGPSAAGKTTLARLLAGLWPAAAGKVRLDGADVFAWDKAELGPHVGYLPQGVELLEGSLAENISRFGANEPAKVVAAAKTVGIHDFIMTLPEAYETQVGRDGARLSGGQRQRVALARALYGDPVYVVLDEPNSSLDDAGDAALSAAIIELKSRGTTFIIMTHRTSILGVADKMLVMQEGLMTMFGPRDEVMAKLTGAPAAPAQSAPAQQTAIGGETPAPMAPA